VTANLTEAAGDNDWSWVTHWTDLLDQDQVWRDGRGDILRLDDMDPGYCARVRSFCLRRAEAVLTYTLYAMTFGPMPSGDVAVDCFNREFDMITAEGEDPKGWLTRFPLLTALKYRSEGLPARPTTCHCGYPIAPDWDHSRCYPGIVVE
jgi:hypothetical protein